MSRSNAAILTLAAALLSSLLSACGHGRGAAYERALAEGARASNAGRARESAEAYERAAAATSNVHDRDVAHWVAGDRYARAGDTNRALEIFDALAAETPLRELTAKAILSAALLRIERVDRDRGHRDLEAMLVRAPNSGAAKTAVRRLLANAEENGAGLAWVEAHLVQLKGTSLEESLLFEKATRLEAKGELDRARDVFVELADRFPYPKGPYFDDALERAAIIEERQNRPERAAMLLERSLDMRTTAWVIGSNQRPRFSASLYRLAKLYAGPLNDHEKAKARYKRLYEDFTASTLRDDALWDEAWLWKSEGKQEQFCDRLAALVSRFPTSRYAPCAERFCPAAKAPKDTTCHDYVLRTVESL